MLVLNILVRIVITRQLQSKISRNTYNLYMLVLNILVRIVTTRQLQSKISRNTYNPIRYSCPNCSCQATTRRGLKTHIQSVHDCVFHILVVIVITTQLKREIWGSTYKLYIIISNTIVRIVAAKEDLKIHMQYVHDGVFSIPVWIVSTRQQQQKIWRDICYVSMCFLAECKNPSWTRFAWAAIVLLLGVLILQILQWSIGRKLNHKNCRIIKDTLTNCAWAVQLLCTVPT